MGDEEERAEALRTIKIELLGGARLFGRGQMLVATDRIAALERENAELRALVSQLCGAYAGCDAPFCVTGKTNREQALEYLARSAKRGEGE